MTYFAKLITYVSRDLGDAMIFLPAGSIAFFAVILLYRLVLYDETARVHCKKILAISLSIAYLVIILFITFFSREPGSRNGLDLLPFATMGHGPRGDAYVLENVLLFIPLGSLLACVLPKGRKRFRHCVFMGFLVSIMIELSQFLTKRGHAQMDDVITNTLGTMIGYLFFICGQMVYKKYFKNVEKNT